MQHDGTLTIATGRSRKEIQWKTREVLWSDLVKRLQLRTVPWETFDNKRSDRKTKN